MNESRWKGVTIKGFQSYKTEQNIPLDPNLTLIAGRNDVGKSALLRVLHLNTTAKPGASQNCEITYSFTVSIAAFDVAGRSMPILAPGLRQQLEVHDSHTLEVTFVPQNWNPSQQFIGNGQWRPSKIRLVELDTTYTYNGAQWQLIAGIDDNALPSLATRVSSAIMGNVSYVAPKKPIPDDAILEAQPELVPDASNLLSVLDYISNNERHTIFRELETFINTAFPDITNLQVARIENSSPLRGQARIVYGQRGDTRVPLAQCGTGVEQLIAIGVGVLTATQPRLFLIDEPQAFLHPHAERSLLNLFNTHPEHQYVVATHSGIFLNNSPIAQARLLSMQESGTKIEIVEGRGSILSEVGLTAADLWLPDLVLWVEGPTEVEAIKVIQRNLGILTTQNVSVKPLPGASRFSSGRQSETTFQFVEAIGQAISPIDNIVRFIFDKDEKDEDLQARIITASHNAAQFLPVREIENFFIDADVVAVALKEVCGSTSHTEPTKTQVQAKITAFLDEIDNKKLYPDGYTNGEKKSLVKGSELFRRLYWEFALTEYDKVRDGARLTEICIDNKPETIMPLTDILREIESNIL